MQLMWRSFQNLCFIPPLLCLLLIPSQTELKEDIPSVKKTIQQASSQASKLLHPPNHDYKKLEVSDRQD